MRKTVIFDLDGTLLDTLEDLWRSVNAALEVFGCPGRTKEQVRQAVGNGVRNLMRLSMPAGEEHPDFEACFHAFQEHYAEHLNDHTGPYEGIMELLAKLREEGYTCAIVSNKSDHAVKELNRRIFGEYIATAIGECEGIRRKPAPDTVFAAMRELGADREDCIYVGDSEVDLLTAKNSGVPCIAVSWGFRDKSVLEELGAECIVDDAGELYERITGRETKG